jgi:probable rRNA maturation factor
MILNRQRRVRVSLRDLDRFLRSASKLLKIPGDSVTICLVSDDEIARWNHAYRGKNTPTDILSFPSGDISAQPPGESFSRRQGRARIRPFADVTAVYLGDIAIAPSVARRNARRFGHAFGDEMRMLVLHGMLHLMGYDHETDGGRMDRRERRLRRALGLA